MQFDLKTIKRTLYGFWNLYLCWTQEFIKNIFGLRNKCLSDRQLNGKVVVITGANTGIGKETAYQLSLRYAKIIIGCRDSTKAENAINDIKHRNPNADINAVQLDLSSLKSVRNFAQNIYEKESKIDILINNAGVGFTPESCTEDGFELHFGTNHLGHFLLTLSLIPLLKKSPKARIINVSSIAYMLADIHFENINLRNGVYSPLVGYSQSKLANILFTRELAKRLGTESTVNVYSLHPGTIKSEFCRHMSFQFLLDLISNLFFINVEMGSQTTLYCALTDKLDNETGFFYDNCLRVENMLSNATNDNSAEMLWELSCDLVKLEDRFKL